MNAHSNREITPSHVSKKKRKYKYDDVEQETVSATVATVETTGTTQTLKREKTLESYFPKNTFGKHETTTTTTTTTTKNNDNNENTTQESLEESFEVLPKVFPMQKKERQEQKELKELKEQQEQQQEPQRKYIERLKHYLTHSIEKSLFKLDPTDFTEVFLSRNFSEELRFYLRNSKLTVSVGRAFCAAFGKSSFDSLMELQNALGELHEDVKIMIYDAVIDHLASKRYTNLQHGIQQLLQELIFHQYDHGDVQVAKSSVSEEQEQRQEQKQEQLLNNTAIKENDKNFTSNFQVKTLRVEHDRIVKSCHSDVFQGVVQSCHCRLIDKGTSAVRKYVGRFKHKYQHQQKYQQKYQQHKDISNNRVAEDFDLDDLEYFWNVHREPYLYSKIGARRSLGGNSNNNNNNNNNDSTLYFCPVFEQFGPWVFPVENNWELVVLSDVLFLLNVDSEVDDQTSLSFLSKNFYFDGTETCEIKYQMNAGKAQVGTETYYGNILCVVLQCLRLSTDEILSGGSIIINKISSY